MTEESSAQLLAQCRAARAAGKDIPSVWVNILRSNPLVVGAPVQTVRAGRIRLEVSLITGGCISFDSDSNEISMQ
jgi:hypothetical protein